VIVDLGEQLVEVEADASPTPRSSTSRRSSAREKRESGSPEGLSYPYSAAGARSSGAVRDSRGISIWAVACMGDVPANKPLLYPSTARPPVKWAVPPACGDYLRLRPASCGDCGPIVVRDLRGMKGSRHVELRALATEQLCSSACLAHTRVSLSVRKSRNPHWRCPRQARTSARRPRRRVVVDRK
jgi:hypothetical protein